MLFGKDNKPTGPGATDRDRAATTAK